MAVPPLGQITTVGGIPVFLSTDASGTQTVPMGQYANYNGIWLPVSSTSEGSLYTHPAGSSTLYAGTFTVATTAGALPAQACSEILLQAAPANAQTVLIGNSTSQSISLAPGQTLALSLANLNLVYASASATGNTLGWMARS